MALDAQILLSILAHETASGDISRTLRATPATYSLTLSDGTGANQAQIVLSDGRAVPASDEDSFDMTNFADDRGVVSLTSVKVLYVRNTGAASLLWIGTEWTNGPMPLNGASLEIKPAGALLMVAPDAQGWLTPGGGDSFIRIDNASNQAGSYEIILIGEGTIT